MKAKNKKLSAKSSKKFTGKRVSISSITEKVIDIVKKPFSKKSPEKKRKPFGGKGGRKRKPTKEEIERQAAQAKIEEIESADVKKQVSDQPSSSIASALNSFFYTDEKFVTQFEDNEILAYIKAVHPEYDPTACDESALKKAVLNILGDSKFMTRLLDRYNMNIFDFFKFMFRIEPSIFRGMFISKV